jgi:ferrochelatase
LPVYFGNRNWHPLLPDTLKSMAQDGIRRAVAFFTSAYSSYSGCRQYRENIEEARRQIGPAAPQVDKLRAFYNHPGFIGPLIEQVREALGQIPPDRRAMTRIVYTAHSIPLSMAGGCRYEAQLTEAARLVSEGLPHDHWKLVYQSRSGPPSQPWLEPDVCDYLRGLHAAGGPRDVVIVPIGFLSDHVEILYDLDIEAKALCQELRLNMVRARTVGNHPDFVRTVRELVLERLDPSLERRFLGTTGPSHDVCPVDCCPVDWRPAGRPVSTPPGDRKSGR